MVSILTGGDGRPSVDQIPWIDDPGRRLTNQRFRLARADRMIPSTPASPSDVSNVDTAHVRRSVNVVDYGSGRDPDRRDQSRPAIFRDSQTRLSAIRSRADRLQPAARNRLRPKLLPSRACRDRLRNGMETCEASLAPHLKAPAGEGFRGRPEGELAARTQQTRPAVRAGELDPVGRTLWAPAAVSGAIRPGEETTTCRRSPEAGRRRAGSGADRGGFSVRDEVPDCRGTGRRWRRPTVFSRVRLNCGCPDRPTRSRLSPPSAFRDSSTTPVVRTPCIRGRKVQS